jgi:hypothetical protein
MTTKCTPGPWRIVRASDETGDPEDSQIMRIEGADGSTVYYTESGYFKPREEDAALIAAALDLAEALLKCVQDLVAGNIVDNVLREEKGLPDLPEPESLEIARAALQKAGVGY